MANSALYRYDGDERLNVTPGSALTGKQVVQLGFLPAYTANDVAASTLGSIGVGGIVEIPYVGGIASEGLDLFWDANGTPYGGTTDGAVVTDPSAGDWWIGTLAAPTVATSATCLVRFGEPSIWTPQLIGKTFVTAATSATLVAATHSGGGFIMTGATQTVTLPTGVVGMDFLIYNGAPDGSLLTIDLDGNEIVAGANNTTAATKVINNTAATAKRGDFMHLVCNVAATSWRCVAKRGIWLSTT